MNEGLSPRIAVLLAAHNGRLWVEEQVDTILRQEGVSVTLFVSVDASCDGTEAWFDDLAAQDNRVRTLPHGVRMGSASANFFRLIAEVPAQDFDYFAFADQDDIWNADKLARASGVLIATGADGYSGNVTALWADGRRALIEKSQPQRRWDFLFEAAGPGCTYVFSPRLFLSLRDFVSSHRSELDAVHLHDWFCYAFARSHGFEWHIDPEPKMLYRQHEENHLGVNSGLDAIITRCRNIVNGWWLTQARTIASLVGLADDVFVRSWLTPGRRFGYLVLLVNTRHCRRKRFDALFMAAVMSLMFVTNPQ
ncbi:glycosyltransferase [Pseudomonas saliphila]|uniref:glycosyltransferase n=1 Tax=Pseudomonas saliphila TaxID=2586906 RepID=UPI00123B270E|nr:glycosyltransferase [Pseudomonas saliphila]